MGDSIRVSPPEVKGARLVTSTVVATRPELDTRAFSRPAEAHTPHAVTPGSYPRPKTK